MNHGAAIILFACSLAVLAFTFLSPVLRLAICCLAAYLAGLPLVAAILAIGAVIAILGSVDAAPQECQCPDCRGVREKELSAQSQSQESRDRHAALAARREVNCPCQEWARDGSDLVKCCGQLLLPDHHPLCPHYNDSLVDVWKTELDGIACYTRCQDATLDELECEDKARAQVTKIKMHREVFERLEFEGF